MRVDFRRLLKVRRDRKRSLRRGLAEELLDDAWYARAHGLSAGRSGLLAHCADIAFTQGLAPRPSMAAEDGVSLAPWAFALLRRLGVQFRAASLRPLEPAQDQALNVEDIRNERGVSLAVVTSIIGDFDRLPIMPEVYGAGADFYVVTDRFFEPFSLWRPVQCPFHHANPRIRSRFAKANIAKLFAAYEWALWVDGNVTLLVDPAGFLAEQMNAETDVAFFAHTDRSSIIEEVEACHRFGKDRLAVMVDELGGILPQGDEIDDVLASGSVFFARTGGAAERFGALWWEMIQTGSQRDQLSLPMALRRTAGLEWRLIPGRPARNPYFKTFNH